MRNCADFTSLAQQGIIRASSDRRTVLERQRVSVWWKCFLLRRHQCHEVANGRHPTKLFWRATNLP